MNRSRPPADPAAPGLPVLTPDVLIVGGGPAGLSAAAALAPLLPGRVLVLEREPEAGGAPRHSDHIGFGRRDLRRLLTGPAYARRLTASARAAGAVIRTRTTVTDWAGGSDGGGPGAPYAVHATGPDGRFRVEPRAIVLATGARERSRAARLVPGDRPEGILTGGELRRAVRLRDRPVGRRAVVVGAEPAGWSAALTLRRAGCRVGLMVSGRTRAEGTPAALTAGATALLGTPVAHRARIVRIIGRRRVEAVEIEHLDSGARRTVTCDTVVLTGDWIPDHELARAAGLDLDPGTLGPLVDSALRTSRPGVFAAGNLVHPADTAGTAALDGRHIADRVAARLADPGPEPATGGARLLAERPFRWVVPGLLRPGDPAPPGGRLLLWSDELRTAPRLVVRHDGRIVAEHRLPGTVRPGRVLRVPWTVVPASAIRTADPARGPVTVGLC
ncbi:FAD-dependent oxidoreductase [Streptomyces sp. NPDC006798]|uniref:NAD(P)/FAD-dependent oxidoreductase n=1 Tax=Streptomyces sp. NPDC006798 TaxID=3155462 RepID=UPI0033D37906